MSVPKAQPLHQTHSVSRTMSVSVGIGTAETDLSPNELERNLTRRLNRRGVKLYVKRRRSNNVTYAEKQLAEIKRRLAHGCDRVAELQLEHAEAERLLTLAHADASNPRNHKARS